MSSLDHDQKTVRQWFYKIMVRQGLGNVLVRRGVFRQCSDSSQTMVWSDYGQAMVE